MKNIKFDSKQVKDGVNKHGHYQFSANSCQYCKGNTCIKGQVVCEACQNYQTNK